MSSLSIILAQLQADLTSANAATGGSDATIHDAITTLISGYGSGTDDSVSTFSQLNSTLAAYLEAAEAEYTENNYATVSVMGDYATMEANYDDPAGYDLAIPAAGTIYLCDEDAPDLSWSDTVSAGTYTVRYGLLYRGVYPEASSAFAATMKERLSPEI